VTARVIIESSINLCELVMQNANVTNKLTPIVLRYHAVYALKEQSDGYMPVNRIYNPVGICTVLRPHPKLFENYLVPKYAVDAVQDIFTKDSIDRYLYDDGCRPWQSNKLLREYIQKLKTLYEAI
jgi:hypothetical protein